VNIQKGQDILVQITKEPVGKKGVRVTSEISLPGRFLVLLPFDGKVGVSKKLNDFKEKRRLRRVVRPILPPGFGAIIRTVAEGKEDALIKQDLEELLRVWSNIEKTVKAEKPPVLVYKDMTTTSSVIRDLFGDRVERVAVDEKKLFKEIKAYVQWMSPDMLDRLEYYKGKEPIFDKYGVEKDIQNLMSKKVWLKSGGYIFIEKTEAMTVIDVNSGRYAAKKEQELNSLRTDLEASREITRQLRLRDIGGIIVIDFIDLEDEKNKKKVYDEVKKELKRDRAKATVLPMTEFGLMQITRQRIRQNVQMSFSDACPTCGGTGMVQSKTTTLNQIERWIKRFKSESREFRLQLSVNPNIAVYLTQGTISRITKIMFKFFVKVKVLPDPALAMDEFKFFSLRQKKDITEQYRL
jgi:ribonuclease G